MNFFDKRKQLKKKKAEEAYHAELQMEHGETDADFKSGLFINSLDHLTEDDIVMNETAEKMSRTSPLEWIRRVLFVFFAGMFVVSCVLLVDNLIDKQKSAAIYDQLQGEFFSSGFSFDPSMAFNPEEGAVSYLTADTTLMVTPCMTDIMNGIEMEQPINAVVQKEYNEELVKMRAGLASLRQINEDLYGWISVEGTTINYPIVQGEDNDYYLDHAYTGDYLPNGSIFADYRNHTSITKNYNTVLYGHNITSGAMFHDVTKFFKDEYFEGVYINVYTDDGIFIYEPFSVYETRYDYNYFKTGFTSAENFIAFAEQMRDNSSMKSKADMTFTERDRILTLSTCTNGAYYARYALHAKLVKTILD
ncbi:MAG: class B sortase [Clostridia bacterium]|nr:class B sortase [Clostridia bacterium]